jgi:S-formylglutathione hydrolase FrmB
MRQDGRTASPTIAGLAGVPSSKYHLTDWPHPWRWRNIMRSVRWLAVAAVLGWTALLAEAGLFRGNRLDRLNRRLHGQLVDHTHNHGRDCRIWSPALEQWRDLYVYLPPGFDPNQRYALGLYLHGATQDEQSFLDMVETFDQAISEGRLPPLIIGVPDGSIQGKPTALRSATFFANSRAGNFEDFLMVDVWNFLMENYPIRPEREAHALVGASMGGSAAFAQAIKHKDQVKVAIGIHPALNMRWIDCHGRYRSHFDPECWDWRTCPKPCESMGRNKGVAVRFGYLVTPMFGRGPDAMDELGQINPIELLDAYDVKEGELSLFVAYGGKDELNIAAQVESFLFRAQERGLTVGVAYDPNGRHDLATGLKLFPAIVDWAAPLMAAKE